MFDTNILDIMINIILMQKIYNKHLLDLIINNFIERDEWSLKEK